MPRDPGLEALVRDDLSGLAGLTEKAMFGGMAWLLQGKLLCAASSRGVMARLGKGQDAWALEHPGVATVVMRKRLMPGWVRASPEAAGDDTLRRKLLQTAKEYITSLSRD